MVTCCRRKLAAGKEDVFSVHLMLFLRLLRHPVNSEFRPLRVEHREREERTVVRKAFPFRALLWALCCPVWAWKKVLKADSGSPLCFMLFFGWFVWFLTFASGNLRLLRRSLIEMIYSSLVCCYPWASWVWHYLQLSLSCLASLVHSPLQTVFLGKTCLLCLGHVGSSHVSCMLTNSGRADRSTRPLLLGLYVLKLLLLTFLRWESDTFECVPPMQGTQVMLSGGSFEGSSLILKQGTDIPVLPSKGRIGILTHLESKKILLTSTLSFQGFFNLLSTQLTVENGFNPPTLF